MTKTNKKSIDAEVNSMLYEAASMTNRHLGNAARASILYEMSGNLEEAMGSARSAKDYVRAIDLYEKAGKQGIVEMNYYQALELAKREGISLSEKRKVNLATLSAIHDNMWDSIDSILKVRIPRDIAIKAIDVHIRSYKPIGEPTNYETAKKVMKACTIYNPKGLSTVAKGLLRHADDEQTRNFLTRYVEGKRK